MKLFIKILLGVVGVALVFGLGYFLMPDKTVEVEKEVVKEVTKNVYVPKTVTVEKIVTVEVPVEKIVQVPVSDPIVLNQLAILRQEKVKGWITVIENKIDVWEAKIKLVDDAIEVVQDKIDAKVNANTLLQATIDSKRLLINALRVDDPVANLAQIRTLEDEIIVLEQSIDNNQDLIDDWTDEIADIAKDKEPWQKKIDLDTKCIAQINAYIANGTIFSEDVEERLEALNLL